MDNTPRVSLSISDRGGAHVVRLEGEIDLSNAERVERELASSLDGPRAVVLDLDRLEFVDLAGARALIRATARAEDRRAIVAGGGSVAWRLLRCAGFAAELPVCSSAAEALALLAGESDTQPR